MPITDGTGSNLTSWDTIVSWRGSWVGWDLGGIRRRWVVMLSIPAIILVGLDGGVLVFFILLNRPLDRIFRRRHTPSLRFMAFMAVVLDCRLAIIVACRRLSALQHFFRRRRLHEWRHELRGLR